MSARRVRGAGLLWALTEIVRNQFPEQLGHFGIPILCILMLRIMIGEEYVHSDYGKLIVTGISLFLTIIGFIFSVRHLNRARRALRNSKAAK